MPATRRAPRPPIAEGILRALTLAPGLVPLGLLFGAAAAEAGMSPSAATLVSALVFAGGAQFAAVGLLATGASALAITGIVAIVNSRYLLLSAATLDLARRAGARAPARIALALGTVDESYALQAAWAKERATTVAGLLIVPATLWLLWVASTLAGALIGKQLPDVEPWGLDYALPGIFVGLLGIFADSRPRLLAGIAALALAGTLAWMGYGVAAVLIVPAGFAFALGKFGPETATEAKGANGR